MNLEITPFFCLADDFIKELRIKIFSKKCLIVKL